jgi:hypothetical protein
VAPVVEALNSTPSTVKERERERERQRERIIKDVPLLYKN